MTTAEPYAVDWQRQAACAGKDTNLFFSTNPARARGICGGCQVRPECLYDAVRTETPFTAYGMRGGLTRTERRSLPALPSVKADAIAVLRELLPPPEDDTAPDERTEQPMNGTQTATPPAATAAPTPARAAKDVEKLPYGQLLKWGDEHPDPEVQAQAARARAALTGLRQRYAADQELAAITTEAEELEQRLAELRARKEQLAPAKSGRRKHSYKAAEVRAWAAANGYDCPSMGRVPKKIVDAWRAAGQGDGSADA